MKKQIAAMIIFALSKCSNAYAFDTETALIVSAGKKTPIGGSGVYSDNFGKRVGTVETLGDGSTVLRGDFGRVIAKAEPRLSNDAPLRIVVKDKK